MRVKMERMTRNESTGVGEYVTSAWWLPLIGEPEYKFNIFGGCTTASIPCVLTDAQRATLHMTRVSIIGTYGLVWRGFVWEVPERGSNLTAVGSNLAFSMWSGTRDFAAETVQTSISYLCTSGGASTLPTWALPNDADYRAWIGSNGVTLDLPAMEGTNLDGLNELLKYSTWVFGWYPEWVHGAQESVPHFYARSTSPDYFLLMRDADQQIGAVSMDGLYNRVRVYYNNGSTYTDVSDTSADHPLNVLGLIRWTTLTVATATLAVASAAGTAFLATTKAKAPKGKKKKKAKHSHRTKAKKVTAAQMRQFMRVGGEMRDVGRLALDESRLPASASIPAYVIRTSAGAIVPPCLIRPGRMVRLLTGTGPVDSTVQEVACRGERSASLTLDRAPYRLDVRIANIERKASK